MLVVIFIILSSVTVYLSQILTSFIYYQKLNNIVAKYSYIIEKYGRLTIKEENNLYNDIKEQGFKLDKIKVSLPSNDKQFKVLSIEYSFNINKINIKNNFNSLVNIKASKSFYIK